MPAHDLALLTHAARDAGVIALRHWKNGPKVWEKPDLGPVSEADLEVNAHLAQLLQQARPGYGWLSEESPDNTARQGREHVFIIDPIDGTRAFLKGEPQFSHSLAVARNGVVTAAVVYLPALDQLYSATLDGPAQRNGTAIQVAPALSADGANMLMQKSILGADHWLGRPPELKRHFRASIAYRLCLVADGSFDGMITLRDAWEWDIAAGSLIAARAGARVTDRTGQPLRFNSPGARAPGVVLAAPGLHADIFSRMKP